MEGGDGKRGGGSGRGEKGREGEGRERNSTNDLSRIDHNGDRLEISLARHRNVHPYTYVCTHTEALTCCYLLKPMHLDLWPLISVL